MKYTDLVKILNDNGFKLLRNSKHNIFSNGVIEIQVPHHREVKENLARAILKQAKIEYKTDRRSKK